LSEKKTQKRFDVGKREASPVCDWGIFDAAGEFVVGGDRGEV